MSTAILEKIRGADNLPTLPAVALQVLEITKNPDSTLDDLADVIQSDPAITIKLLKMVNSSMFGLSRSVTSIKQAIGLLGSRTVRVMALSFSLVDMMNEDQEGGFDYPLYWRHSLTTAVAGRLIANSIGSKIGEEAFVGGLLANIGRLAAVRCASEEYQGVLVAGRQSERPLHEIESEILGTNHAAMGEQMLSDWGLPENLCAAVGAHHGEGLESLKGENAELARLVHAAANVAGIFCQDIPCTELDAVKQECQELTKIDSGALEAIFKKLDAHVHEAASSLAVQIGDTVDYAALRGQATTQLTQISLEAEMDRTRALNETARLHEEKKAILQVASTDGLTKIANRASFDQRLAEEVDRAGTARSPLGLIILDVDHFKKFNDTEGHQAGDEVLRRIAAVMSETVGENGFAARYGGEEFVVILPKLSSADVAGIAEDVRAAIEGAVVEFEGKQLRVTASLGCVHVRAPEPGVAPGKLISVADKLLYQAKRSGRNQVCFVGAVGDGQSDALKKSA